MKQRIIFGYTKGTKINKKVICSILYLSYTKSIKISKKPVCIIYITQKIYIYIKINNISIYIYTQRVLKLVYYCLMIIIYITQSIYILKINNSILYIYYLYTSNININKSIIYIISIYIYTIHE